MKRLLFSFLLAPLFLGSCSQPKELPPMEIMWFSLSAEAPQTLSTWYRSNLGLSMEEHEDGLKLSKGNVMIEIQQHDKEAEPVPIGQRQPGFFKIGFKTPDLDAVYQTLISSGSDMRGEIFFDSNLQTRSVVSLDSEGNRVQFFEDKNIDGLVPYFFSIMALDFEQTRSWVETEFGFSELHNLDLPERGLSIRLMAKDKVLLELIGIEGLEQNDFSQPGIAGIAFNLSMHSKGGGELKYQGL